MFVMTVKFNKKTAVAILIALAVLLAAIVIIAGQSNAGEAGSKGLSIGGKVATNEARIEYLKDLGYEVVPDPISEKTVLIPREFNEIFNEYNLLQRKQGFDLSQYKGLEVILYTYQVTNYPNTSEEVYAELYVRNGHVIGGDIHSTALDGFMHGFK